MHRLRPAGGNDTIAVVLGKKEAPAGTLDGILEVGHISRQEFAAALKKHRR
jgi:hypothetical protein